MRLFFGCVVGFVASCSNSKLEIDWQRGSVLLERRSSGACASLAAVSGHHCVNCGLQRGFLYVGVFMKAPPAGAWPVGGKLDFPMFHICWIFLCSI